MTYFLRHPRTSRRSHIPSSRMMRSLRARRRPRLFKRRVMPDIPSVTMTVTMVMPPPPVPSVVTPPPPTRFIRMNYPMQLVIHWGLTVSNGTHRILTFYIHGGWPDVDKIITPFDLMWQKLSG